MSYGANHMKILTKFHSIKVKIILLLSIIILVVNVGMGYMSYYISSNALIENLNQILPEMAKESALLIENNIESNLDLLDAIVYSLKDGKMTQEQISTKLKIQETKGRYLLLGIADTKGNLVMSSDKVINIQDLTVYKKALNGERSVSEPSQDMIGISGISTDSLIVVYALPMKVGGKIDSVLIAVRSGNEFSTLVNDITFGKTGKAFMVNEKGDMIANENLSLVYDKVNYISVAAQDKSFSKLAALLTIMKEGKGGSGEYTYNGIKKYAGYAPVGATGWSIVLAGDSSDMLSGLKKLGSSSVIFTLLFVNLGVIAVFFVTRSLTNGLRTIVNHITTMAKGDLAQQIPTILTKKKDEIGVLAESLVQMQDFTGKMIYSIKSSSSTIDDQSENLFTISRTMTVATDHVTTAIQDIAKGAGEQADELSKMLGSLDHFSQELGKVVLLLDNVGQKTNNISTMAEDSNYNMKSLVKSSSMIQTSFEDFKSKISNLGESVKKVNEIANFINSIAEQTNLLSLNATIEAARAGEAGRGFAVVADSIRNFAEQNRVLSVNINSIISGVTKETEQMKATTYSLGKELNQQIEVLNTSILSFENMIEAFQRIAPEIDVVNTAVYELDDEKNRIIQNIEGVASIAEEVSASTQEIAATAQEMSASMEDITSSARVLNGKTGEMKEQVEQFVIVIEE
ncbi:MAG: methyl-accepting chemotaxis protein [Mobilitalea sp.]